MYSPRPRPPRLPAEPLPLNGSNSMSIRLIAFFTYRTKVTREAAAERLAYTLGTVEGLSALSGQLSEAESAQRGYLLTGEDPGPRRS